MKGLIRSGIIIMALIVAGIISSIIITVELNNRLATALEHGFKEGYAQGSLEGYQEGSRVGYQEGSKLGYVRGNWKDYGSGYEEGFYFLYNPTYDELQEILAESEASSAKEIHKYAEAYGIRVAYVRCQIARKATEGMVWIHQLVAFETVDSGFIIIEPWSYREVKVEVGKHYSELNGLPPRSYDDTVTKITIVW